MSEWYDSLPLANTQASAPAPVQGGNWWESMPLAQNPSSGNAPKAETEPSVGSVAGQFTAGANRTIADIAGIPGDIASAIGYPAVKAADLVSQVVRKLVGAPQLTDEQLKEADQNMMFPGSSQSIVKAMQSAGINAT